MYGYNDHNHRGEYADESHSHREVDEVRWDLERKLNDEASQLNDRIRAVAFTANDHSELWGELEELRKLIGELRAHLDDHVHKTGSHS